MRFAQMKMDTVERGVVGIITNRWWLDNVTFRGMRQSILETFDLLYIIDLGGEAGSENSENVFDITKGVAITIAVKGSGLAGLAEYVEITGTQLDKYRRCASLSLQENLEWQR